ncbi:hypothetical protein M231_06862 [Tremella mesenterica]|uniref:ferric-chelate reductase (NADPH) n=1 Tax=Tremella mesenterica TaxID=5217 RepID=A0A4Q1BD78_TREME|nr:hypothetical protein M231_06862 [Tremella mesenterica]
MDMGHDMSSIRPQPTTTLSALAAGQTDFTPGYINSKGDYVPLDDELTAYQAARIPWADEVRYGHYALFFLGAILVISTLLHLYSLIRARFLPDSTSKLLTGRLGNVKTRILAVARILTYPQLPYSNRLVLIWTFGPLGPNLLLAGGLVLVSLLTWINKYYYYAPFYGSAPLYLRSEWIAMATLPFVYILGTKRNLISLLTGVSHDKLQVFHQGVAFNFVYMSLVHTITAIIRAYRDYGFVKEVMYNPIYVSGFVALAPLCVLFLGALPPVRRWTYEVFYYVHIVMALFFMGALWWHGYQLLDSDKYMIATAVLFFSSVLWRLVMIAFNNPTFHSCTATLLSSDTLKLTIPTTIHWGPGQHVFLRFIGLRTLESHPFSIATLPISFTVSVAEMNFLVRVRSGFTQALANRITAQGGQGKIKCVVDGPYGHCDLGEYPEIFIAVGGSGISWGLGVLQHVAVRKGGKVKMVWAIRHADALEWFSEELQILAKNPGVDIHIYLTDQATQASDLQSKEDTTDDKLGTMEATDGHTVTTALSQQVYSRGNSELSAPGTKKDMTLHSGRPDLPLLIEEFVRQNTSGSCAVAACGPGRFITDCANAVSKAEVGILLGTLKVEEVFFKSEQYTW